jgi:hypothetical protein
MGGKRENFRWDSGIPIFGSLLVAISLFKFWQTPWLLALAIVLILVDTGGLHWFAGTLLYYEVLKKSKPSNNGLQAKTDDKSNG